MLLAIQSEQIVLRGTLEKASVPEVAEALPSSEPCYALFNFEHKREGEISKAVIFLYVCPENSAVKLKMLHASSKGSVLHDLESLGIVADKSLEGVEAADLTETFLLMELYPSSNSDDIQTTFTKAAPKGGRKLHSRNKR